MSLGDNVLFYTQSFEAGRQPKDNAAQTRWGTGEETEAEEDELFESHC